MQSRWFSNCKTEDAKKEMRARLVASAPVLDRLREIVQDKLDAATNPSSADYDSPSWAYKQAHNNGVAEALRDIIKYLDTTD